MNKFTKCYKCGKQYPLDFKSLKERITCDHCHAKMMLSPKIARKNRYISILLVALVASGSLYVVATYQTIKDLPLTMIVLSGSLALSLISEKICLYISNMLFGLEYVEYIKPVTKKKKNGRK